ncbi:hypothetical protein OBBRIDRAFT_113376 [Obba rivulosa]|uniref:Uncharacterized protein n=1 Tax=Obba rivulosa TaxID=1052685 RepID=A0A8E2ANR5_9APHY|nr:hypothetical protein OBBRIDRAFT_113376 [Obba rivulosa]
MRIAIRENCAVPWSPRSRKKAEWKADLTAADLFNAVEDTLVHLSGTVERLTATHISQSKSLAGGLLVHQENIGFAFKHFDAFCVAFRRFLGFAERERLRQPPASPKRLVKGAKSNRYFPDVAPGAMSTLKKFRYLPRSFVVEPSCRSARNSGASLCGIGHRK